jgi:hypothetical protein
MAIPSSSPTSAVEAPIIENELPAYRAISRMAVFSLILGLASILCFTDGWFLVAAAGAVVTGALATRKISRLPEVLTGSGLAQAGIALGLIFGLASVTVDFVQGKIREREARKFANEYLTELKTGILTNCVWYKLPPGARKTLPKEKALAEMERGAGPEPGRMIEQFGPYRELLKRLSASPSETIQVEGVERQGLERLEPYAIVVYRLTGPGDPANKILPHDYAMMLIKGKVEGNKYEWYIDDLRYPYVPNTHVPTPAPVDDGHGHGPGGH